MLFRNSTKQNFIDKRVDSMIRKVILIVLDSVGAGEMPDAAIIW